MTTTPGTTDMSEQKVLSEDELRDLISDIRTALTDVHAIALDGHLQALQSRIQTLESERGWRDISTAPKDGTRVWLWLEDEGFGLTGKWSPEEDDCDACWWLCEWDCGGQVNHITHWMPLPSPPQESK